MPSVVWRQRTMHCRARSSGLMEGSWKERCSASTTTSCCLQRWGGRASCGASLGFEPWRQRTVGSDCSHALHSVHSPLPALRWAFQVLSPCPHMHSRVAVALPAHAVMIPQPSYHNCNSCLSLHKLHGAPENQCTSSPTRSPSQLPRPPAHHANTRVAACRPAVSTVSCFRRSPLTFLSVREHGTPASSSSSQYWSCMWTLALTMPTRKYLAWSCRAGWGAGVGTGWGRGARGEGSHGGLVRVQGWMMCCKGKAGHVLKPASGEGAETNSNRPPMQRVHCKSRGQEPANDLQRPHRAVCSEQQCNMHGDQRKLMPSSS